MCLASPVTVPIARAGEVIDCTSRDAKIMVMTAVDEFLVMSGLPSGTFPPAVLDEFKGATSPYGRALQLQMERKFGGDVTVCELNDGKLPVVLFLTVFVKTGFFGNNVGGFVMNFGAPGAIATFGGFELSDLQ